MIATISTSSQLRVSSTMDRNFSRHSNMARGPLPLVPRRSMSASRISQSSKPSVLSISPKSTGLVKVSVSQSTPPERTSFPSTDVRLLEDSESSTTSSSSLSDDMRPTIAPRSKRVRGQRMAALCPPELSTPTPTVFDAKADVAKRRSLQIDSIGYSRAADTSDNETPRSSARIISPTTVSPHLNLEPLQSRQLSESDVHAYSEAARSQSPSAPILIPADIETRFVRKKSGQPVKSSLKSSRQIVRGSLSVVTHGGSSKSEPNTPTPSKAVHFDAHLEHVKLFLAEQKPLAVSRDGSPTEDTSGTESDFPAFIYGSSSSSEKIWPNDVLNMRITNMSSKLKEDLDVELEELKLSEDTTTILGRVRVRNIAFQKWLAVRFTFDNWQTTSEVTAKYAESLSNAFDRFSFCIKLNDLLARIEEKTLLLALRYTVDGREIWDNNGGQNYCATFTKEKPQVENTKCSAESDIERLKSKLEKVVQRRDDENSAAPLLRQASALERGKRPAFKTGGSLAARYDFGTSLKNPWKPLSLSPTPLGHHRMSTHPSATPASPSSIPWPQKATSAFSDKVRASLGKPNPNILGSPRDIDEDAFRQPVYPRPDPVVSLERPLRNHQRGYFDIMSETSGVRMTPPGTPRIRSLNDVTPLSSPRFYSYPPVDSSRSPPLFGPGLGLVAARTAVSQLSGDLSGGSEQSTPSFLSPSISSSSSSTSLSPSEGFTTPSFNRNDPLIASPTTDYHQFLDKFCFYTGSESVQDISGALPRAHSASSVEGLLSQSPRSPQTSPPAATTPTRSPSADNLAAVIRSGSSTPTARNFGALRSLSATPTIPDSA